MSSVFNDLIEDWTADRPQAVESGDNLSVHELRDCVRQWRKRAEDLADEMIKQSKYHIDALNERNRFMEENIRLIYEVAALHERIAVLSRSATDQKPAGISSRALNSPMQQIGLIMPW